jgi:aryl-alcohol dehydrogenase-like predicted oxidoreductase
VQLPLNLYESGAALEANNDGVTALKFCREKGIGVLANRPLNAFFRNRMVRLADFVPPGDKRPAPERLFAMLEPLRKLEQELFAQFDVPPFRGAIGGIAGYFARMLPEITSPAHWEQAFYPYVVQPLERWAVECQQLYGGHKEWREWWQRFSQMLPAVLEEASRYVSEAQQAVSDEVRAQMKLAGYANGSATLSQVALSALLRLEGLSSVLVGMRRPEYVADAFAALDQQPDHAIDSLSILRRFRANATAQH